MHLSGSQPADHASVVIATNNPAKLAEFRELLSQASLRVAGLNAENPLLTIEESGDSYEVNARIKAVTVAKHVRGWALGDDTGLEVAALGGVPGIRTSRFAGEN